MLAKQFSSNKSKKGVLWPLQLWSIFVAMHLKCNKYSPAPAILMSFINYWYLLLYVFLHWTLSFMSFDMRPNIGKVGLATLIWYHNVFYIISNIEMLVWTNILSDLYIALSSELLSHKTAVAKKVLSSLMNIIKFPSVMIHSFLALIITNDI